VKARATLAFLGASVLSAACSNSDTPGAAGLQVDRLSGSGADVLGAQVEDGWLERFVGERVRLTGPDAARATLVRFWTDGCPFCEASLPALEELRAELGPRGLATLAVYHPKPPRSVAEDEVVAAARERGYHGPLAIDADWSALDRFWLRDRDRGATSASLLLDREGVVRFVHPGPVFHPADSAAGDFGPEAVAGWRALRTAVEALLDEP